MPSVSLALARSLVAPGFRVAMLRLAIGRPSWVRRISGSLPGYRPIAFTLPAIFVPQIAGWPDTGVAEFRFDLTRRDI